MHKFTVCVTSRHHTEEDKQRSMGEAEKIPNLVSTDMMFRFNCLESCSFVCRVCVCVPPRGRPGGHSSFVSNEIGERDQTVM